MVSCEELKMKAPSCFEVIGMVEARETILPDYYKAYRCFRELSIAFNVPLKDVWYDEALSERIIQCYRLSRHPSRL